jgi:hypothetical protein
MRAVLHWRWPDLPIGHRRWILYNAILVTALMNLVLNAGITWLMVQGAHRVPLWTTPLPGRPNIITDTVGTFFMLPLITCLLITTSVWHEVRVGRLPPLMGTPRPQSLLARLPTGRLRRGAYLGGVCALVLSPLSALVLIAVDSGGLSTPGFVLYKAMLGVALGAIVTPVIALCAMADTATSVNDRARSPQLGVQP